MPQDCPLRDGRGAHCSLEVPHGLKWHCQHCQVCPCVGMALQSAASHLVTSGKPTNDYTYAELVVPATIGLKTWPRECEAGDSSV